MPKKTAELLRNQAAGLDRLTEHVLRRSARPEQVAQSIRATAAEVRRAAKVLDDVGQAAYNAAAWAEKLTKALDAA